jgi:hypothetical protein
MRIAFRFLALALSSLILVACMNKEPEERAAFIAWLQTQVLDATDTHVPALDETQRDALGQYAEQYAVLSDFEGLAQTQLLHLANTFDHERLTSVAQIQARHEMLRADRRALTNGLQSMRVALERARTLQAEWKQPADLRAVYDAAFNKAVVPSMAEVTALTQVALAALNDTLSVADYLQAHAQQLTIDGQTAAVRDPSVQRELNQLLDKLNSHTVAVEAAAMRLQELQRQ